MGVRFGFSSGILAALALGLAVPAAAQFSDSYNFLQAVKDRDGDKVMTYLNKPGQPVLTARDSNGDTALHMVVRRHDQTWVTFLLSRGAQVDARDRDGNTPLMLASQLSDSEIAQVLLTVGANVNATNTRGETALILAVQQRNLPIIRLLVTNGADPKIADTFTGKTARDYAVEDSRSTAIVKLLDDAKPKPAPAKVSGPVLR